MSLESLHLHLATSESHFHYGTFVGSFEWDEMDYKMLMTAKREQVMNAEVSNPSVSDKQEIIGIHSS